MNWFLSLSTALASMIAYQESIKVELLPSPTPQVVEISKPEPEPEPPQLLGSNSNSILDQINQYRAQHGLSPAQENPVVCEFASLRAQEITQNFDHNGFVDRLKSGSLPYSNYSLATENIAQVNDVNILVDMWIASPTHEENIRKDTPYICVRNVGDYYAYAGWKP